MNDISDQHPSEQLFYVHYGVEKFVNSPYADRHRWKILERYYQKT